VNGRPIRLGLAAMIAFLATTAAVLGSTGQLGAKGCIADPANNVDKCAQTALGLDTRTPSLSVPTGDPYTPSAPATTQSFGSSVIGQPAH
jgi:hypothetical protein